MYVWSGAARQRGNVPKRNNFATKSMSHPIPYVPIQNSELQPLKAKSKTSNKLMPHPHHHDRLYTMKPTGMIMSAS